LAIPSELTQWAQEITQLGYRITHLGPANTRTYINGKWQATVWVPSPITPLGGDAFPDGGRRLINYTKQQKAKGVEIYVTLG